MVERKEGHVFTGHTSFYLVPGAQIPRGHWPSSLTTGLVSAREDEVRVTTGTHTGDVRLVTETHDREPPDDPAWEDVAEISVAVLSGELHVLESRHPPLFGNLATSGPGDYRVRVHGNNRGDERAGRGSRDTYLVEVWPAPRAEEKLVRLCEQSRQHLEGARQANREPIPDLPRPNRSRTPRPAPQPMAAPGGPSVTHYESVLRDPATSPADGED